MFVMHIVRKLVPETLFFTFKADTISSRPTSRLGGVNTTGVNKLEARKLQMLVSQRKKLEEELLVLEDEILNAVWANFRAFLVRLMTSTGEEAPPKNPEVR
jgi:hypothetical protein